MFKMTPASDLLKSYRENRGLSQKKAAYLLGCGQSFMSAIEAGISSIPQNGFVAKVVRQYNLTPYEEMRLKEAMKVSNRFFTIPDTAASNLVEIFNAVFNQLENLNDLQIDLISLVLQINSINKKDEVESSTGVITEL